MKPDYNRLREEHIEAAVRRAGQKFGLTQAPLVGIAANMPGARVLIDIDPVTGMPVEPDTSHFYSDGDVIGMPGKGLAP